jgi:membrane protein DedA with SNARE-associated domain
LAGFGELNLGLVFCLACLAALLSDQFLYLVGIRRGSKVLSTLCRISLDPDSCVRRTKNIFIRYGARSLLVAKFLPGVATIAPTLAGISHMRLVRFLLFDGLGTLIWVGVFVLLGYQFGRELEDFITTDGGLGSWVGLIVPVGLAAYIAWKYIQRKRFLHQLAIARITPEEVKQRLDAGDAFVLIYVTPLSLGWILVPFPVLFTSLLKNWRSNIRRSPGTARSSYFARDPMKLQAPGRRCYLSNEGLRESGLLLGVLKRGFKGLFLWSL